MAVKLRILGACALACCATLLAACVQPSPGGGPTTTIDTENEAPMAVATGPTDPVFTSTLVSFSSTGSSDSDGTIVSTEWDFGDFGTSSDADPTYRYWAPGTYDVTLTVTDDDGAQDTTTIQVVVADDPAGRYVAPSGADAGDCGASATPCQTINYAVGQATPGDTVYLAPGSYPEIVVPNKELTFLGANSGVPAGVDAQPRGPESVVRGFRTTSITSAAANSLTVDGVEIDPTSDPALLTNAIAMIRIFGGPSVRIVNNVFTGAHEFAPNCSYTCTDMGDYAIEVRGGNVEISENHFENWRRPLNLIGAEAANPITSATIEDNVFIGITSRAMSIGASTGVHNMAGVHVVGNYVDATGRGPDSSPAGLVVTNHSNLIEGNTFKGLSSGVFISLCKKFSTDNNTVAGNTFIGNGGGVNVTTIPDTSQCNSSATEGSGGWVVGGGRATGLVVTGNSFEDQLSYAIRFNPNFSDGTNPYATVITPGTLDATCNWYGDPSGPGGTNGVVQGPPDNAQWVTTPWLTSPGGACDGGV
jgi:PKD repeat protein